MNYVTSLLIQHLFFRGALFPNPLHMMIKQGVAMGWIGVKPRRGGESISPQLRALVKTTLCPLLDTLAYTDIDYNEIQIYFDKED